MAARADLHLASARSIRLIARAYRRALATVAPTARPLHVDLLDDPAELSDSIVDSAERDLLGAFSDRVNVRVSDDDRRIAPQRTEIDEARHGCRMNRNQTTRATDAEKEERASRISAEGPLRFLTVSLSPKV